MKIAPPLGRDRTEVALSSGTGGDLSGSLPAPTVVGVGGIPVNVSATSDGNVLTYVAAYGDIELLAPSAASGFMTTSHGGLEDIHTVTSSGASQTLDLADGNVQDVTLTASCTLTLAGATTGKACSMTLILRQGGSGSYTVSWPGSLVWPSGTAPTLATTVGQLDLVALLTLDGGTTWYGFHSGAGGITNPMTTQDDVIVGAASGVPARLAKGSDSQVLTVSPSTHHLVWAAVPAGFTNPMSAVGDLIRGGTAGAATALAIGSTGQVLTVAAGIPAWAAPSGTGALLVEDGSSAPPVTLTNEAEDDWLYADL